MYIVFSKRADGHGFAVGYNNRRVLSDATGINYNTLTNHFVRRGEVWHYYEDEGVFVIRVRAVLKGRHMSPVKRDLGSRHK